MPPDWSSFFENADLRKLKVLWFDDPSKIVVQGRGIAEILRRDYGLEVEMESLNYVILMTSLLDTEEGFRRLTEALHEMDHLMSKDPERLDCVIPRTKSLMTMSEATEAVGQRMKISDTAGMISAEYLYLYPPGIPVVVPGEQLTEQILQYLDICDRAGLKIKGSQENGWIRVLKK